MSVLVIGCGYLGAKAADLWVQDAVPTRCMTRSLDRTQQFQNAGYVPLFADITQPDSLEANQLEDLDTVLFSVGFDRSRYQDIREVYVTGLANVLAWLPKSIKQFIYVSSTGVYGNCNGEWIDENSPTDPQRPGGRACLQAESLIRESWLGERATILRLAGIYGPQRVPRLDAVNNQSWESLSQLGHINLIHVDDAARIIREVSKQEITNELFLVADGNPPRRKDFYEFIAKSVGVEPIDWTVSEDPESNLRAKSDKKVSNQKLVERIRYKYLYPDFRSGIANALSDSN